MVGVGAWGWGPCKKGNGVGKGQAVPMGKTQGREQTQNKGRWGRQAGSGVWWWWQVAGGNGQSGQAGRNV